MLEPLKFEVVEHERELAVPEVQTVWRLFSLIILWTSRLIKRGCGTIKVHELSLWFGPLSATDMMSFPLQSTCSCDPT
jgi:hypothetical protein